MRIEFKAYGGTGALIGRCFVTLLALNACDVATEAHKDDVCVLYQLDYDESTPIGNRQTEASYLKLCVENYQNLHNRGLGFLAPIRLEQDTHTLKDIRERAYGDVGDEFSLRSLFCRGRNSAEIYELLSSAFTTNEHTLVEEIERSNSEGCYGDLAVNGFISERIIATGAFAASGIYNSLGAAVNNSIVFYAGSTDGGTANTMIDKDIVSLLTYLSEQCNVPIGHNRTFKLYGLRSTPYSYFNNQNGEELDRAVTNSILRDKFQMSQGVLDKIQHQNSKASNNQIKQYSYYKINRNINYWLDGLFLAGSDTLDLTDSKARKDGQYHPSHLVELALAEQAMDAIAGRLPALNDGVPHLYGYNDGGSDTTHVTAEGFFGETLVSYRFEIYDSLGTDEVNIPLYKYIRALMLTLVTIKGRMISDLKNYTYSNRKSYRYIYDLFLADNQEVATVCEKAAEQLERFLGEVKFIVMTFVNIMDYSRFRHEEQFVDLVESAVRYVYDYDNFGNALEKPAGNDLSISDATQNRTIELSQFPEFSVLDTMHQVPYHQGNIFGKGSLLKHEKAFDSYLRGHNDDESAYNVANDYIKRTFETYLAYLM